MRKPFIASLIAGLLAAASGPTVASAAVCDVWAHINDKDPKGTNLRAGPSSKARVLSRVKPYRISGRENVLPPIVRVVEQRGGWYRISAAEAPVGKRVFSGRAWVHGSLLAVQIRGGAALYKGSSKRSGTAQPGGDVEADGALLACRGKWVRIRHGETKRIGWLAPDDHCPGAETSCS